MCWEHLFVIKIIKVIRILKVLLLVMNYGSPWLIELRIYISWRWLAPKVKVLEFLILVNNVLHVDNHLPIHLLLLWLRILNLYRLHLLFGDDLVFNFWLYWNGIELSVVAHQLLLNFLLFDNQIVDDYHGIRENFIVAEHLIHKLLLIRDIGRYIIRHELTYTLFTYISCFNIEIPQLKYMCDIYIIVNLILRLLQE